MSKRIISTCSTRGRPAFTLVELLVVIAIIGVLVALLLPAVQQAREAARRCICGNNLTQLIIGVGHYEMSHGMYPPGTIDAQGPVLNARLGYHHNWLVQILPYIEQRNTWNALDKTVGVYHPKNAPVADLNISLFRCPSDPAQGEFSNYAGCHHEVESPINVTNNGVFFLNSKVRYEDIPDGSSHTIFLGEKLPDDWDLGWISGTRASLRNTGAPINALRAAKQSISGGVAGKRSPLPAAPPPESLISPDLRQPPADGGAAPAGGPTIGLGNPRYVGGFESQHPLGAQFAFGDGSVRFMMQLMNFAVLQQLAHRADGKLLNGEY